MRPWLWCYRCLEIMKGLIFMVHLCSLSHLWFGWDLWHLCCFVLGKCLHNFFLFLKNLWHEKFQPFLHIPIFLWTPWSSISKSNRRCANEINVKFVVLEQKCLFLPINGIGKWQPLFFGGYGIVLRSFKKF